MPTQEFYIRVAQAYEAMEHNPFAPDVQSAYRAFIHETYDQYFACGIRVIGTEENPYPNSAALFSDVRSGVCRVFTGGSLPIDHPLMEPTPDYAYTRGLKTANDVFRAVHDIYGHAAIGAGFGPKGEERAYANHSRMYSPLARLAMTTETRGQNCWFQQHNSVGVYPKVYAPQKAGLLPDDLLVVES